MSEATIALIAIAVASVGGAITAVAGVGLQVISLWRAELARKDAALLAEQDRIEAAKVAKQAKEDAEKAQAATEVAAMEASKARVKAEEAEKELKAANVIRDEQMKDLAKVANVTHKLVNKAFLVQLRIAATALRRVAELNNDDPADVKAAEIAEQALKDHEAAQSQADREQKVAGTDADNTLKANPTPLKE